MIPKVIHAVWVGGKPLTKLAQNCLKSWKKFCPNYEIKIWNESNFDINQNLFCKQAYENKKWAFVADYIRLKVLNDFGGVYMDLDVEVVKPLDNFLVHPGFSGFECTLKIPTGIIASEKENAWTKLMLSYYDNRPFVKENGSFENLPNVIFMTEYTQKKYGIELNDKFQDLQDFVFYPHQVFCPNLDEYGVAQTSEKTVTIHHFAGSWLPKSLKRKKKINSVLKNILGFCIGKKNLQKILKKRQEKLDINNNELYKSLNEENKKQVANKSKEKTK